MPQRPKRILIVDDEPAILRMVESLMERHGHEVDKARNGREGLQKAQAFLPDLVITDVLMPEMDGWAFVRDLRSRKEFNLVPVIFLTALNSAKDRILGFRLGADDYLQKPFHLEELEIRVERVLRRSAKMAVEVQQMISPATPESAIGLNGKISQIGVSSVLTILEMERKSGVLVLKEGLRTGRVFMKEGRALDAFFDGRPKPRGADAVYEMLTWCAGRFEFSYLEVEMEDAIKTSTTHLLMEGARRIDEADI
jgi:two-component system OmpR family response regulator